MWNSFNILGKKAELIDPVLLTVERALADVHARKGLLFQFACRWKNISGRLSSRFLLEFRAMMCRARCPCVRRENVCFNVLR